MLQYVCEQHSLRGRAVVIHFVALGGQRVGVALSCKTDNMLPPNNRKLRTKHDPQSQDKHLTFDKRRPLALQSRRHVR